MTYFSRDTKGCWEMQKKRCSERAQLLFLRKILSRKCRRLMEKLLEVEWLGKKCHQPYMIFPNILVFLLILCFFFNFRASERGDSPWCSSLNHSYETLNMPDSASDHEPSLGKKCALKKKDKFMSDRILLRDFNYYFRTF